MARTAPEAERLRVVVLGGGVAGLEVVLALRALAEERVALDVLAPEPHFWYRPLAVAEPLSRAGPKGRARRHRARVRRPPDSCRCALRGHRPAYGGRRRRAD